MSMYNFRAIIQSCHALFDVHVFTDLNDENKKKKMKKIFQNHLWFLKSKCLMDFFCELFSLNHFGQFNCENRTVSYSKS